MEKKDYGAGALAWVASEYSFSKLTRIFSFSPSIWGKHSM